MFHYEMHMHTSPVSACAASTPEDMVDAYARLGYAGIVITDHFVNGSSGCPRCLDWKSKMRYLLSGYEKAKKRGDVLGLDVFYGWEYTYYGIDFLTYGLGLDFLYAHSDMEDYTPEEYCSIVRTEGGFVAQAHPFRKGWWIRDPGPVSPGLLDAVEVYNAAMDKHINSQALTWARRHKLPQMAGTDSHHSEIKKPSGIALANRAESITDILNAIRSGTAALIRPSPI